MVNGSYEAALTELERSKEPPTVILQQAAKIVNIDLDECLRKYSNFEDIKIEPSSTSFREQWLLRWFLNKLNFCLKHRVEKGHASVEEQFIISPKSWMFFLHLAHSIPTNKCLSILLERSFFNSFGRCLQIVLRQLETTSSTTSNHVSQAGSIDSDHERSSKRQKRENSVVEPVQNFLNQAEAYDFQALILEIANYLTMIAGNRFADYSRGSYASKLTGSLPETDVCLFIGESISMVSTLLRFPSSEGIKQQAFKLLQKLLHFWQFYASLGRSARPELHKEYNKYCLRSYLSLLDILQSSNFDNAKSRRLVQQIEQSIAVITIVPIRTLILEKHLQQWNTDTKSLTRDVVEPTVTSVMQELGQNPQHSHGQMVVEEENLVILPRLFDIALRSFSSVDYQRKQQEQPWLNVLFVSLIYIYIPEIPRPIVNDDGTIEQSKEMAPHEENEIRYTKSTFEKLLSIATKQGFHPSLKILTYLMAGLFQWGTREPLWNLFAQLIQLNVSVLLPNSSSPSSKHLLENLCNKIRSQESSESELDLIRDQIIVPIMQGFANNRDFRTFIPIWRTNLKEAMLTLQSFDHKVIPTVLVWHDEKVFDEFNDIIKHQTLSDLPKILADETIQDIQGAQHQGGFSLDIISRICILTEIINVSINDLDHVKLPHQQLHNIAGAIILKLQSHDTFHGHRWRLWRFLAQVHGTRRLTSPKSLNTIIKPSPWFVTLEASKDFITIQNKLDRAGKYMECFQCFCLLLQNAGDGVIISSHMVEELRYLSNAFKQLINNTAFDQAQSIWNGRFIDMDSKQKLLTACIGQVMCNLHILERDDTASIEIMSCLVYFTNIQDGRSSDLKIGAFHQLANSVVLPDELIRSKDSRRLIVDQILQHLRHRVAEGSEASLTEMIEGLERLSKSDVNNLAIALRSQILIERPTPSIESISLSLSLLDRISDLNALSVLRPEEWTIWMTGLDRLSTCSYDPQTRPFEVAHHCITNILKKIWKRTFEIQSETQRKKTVNDIFSWCYDNINTNKTFNYGLSTFLAVKIVLGEIYASNDLVSGMVNKNEFEEARKLFLRTVQEDLHSTVGILEEARSFKRIEKLLKVIIEFSNIRVMDDRLTGALDQINTACLSLTTNGLKEQTTDLIETSLRIESQLWHLKSLSRSQATRPDLETLTNRLLSLETSLSTMSTNADMRRRLNFIDNYIHGLDATYYSTILELLQEKSFSQKSKADGLLLIAVIVVRTDGEDLSKLPELAHRFANSAALANLSTSRTLEEVLLHIENARLVLTLHPDIVNQDTIEMLFRYTASLLSKSEEINLELDDTSSNSSGGATVLYDRLCALIGILLARFRRRFADRYHLLLPIMQKLLKCFFYPGKGASTTYQPLTGGSYSVILSKSLPDWLQQSQMPLSPASAEKYSRLLSSICNPTMSAARSTRKRARNELKDETQKVRRIAGQHMQYVIMEYAKCTLAGQILPEVKEKLMPGLFSILNSMSRDLMRSMNAEMDPSSRAIFKTLYDDWLKFGKWDNN